MVFACEHVSWCLHLPYEIQRQYQQTRFDRVKCDGPYDVDELIASIRDHTFTDGGRPFEIESVLDDTYRDMYIPV